MDIDEAFFFEWGGGAVLEASRKKKLRPRAATQLCSY